jgi:hypothetical protein
MVRRASSWAHARTVLVLGGLGFAGASLISACLDHYAEDWGCEAAPSGSAAALRAGSGEGSAAVPATTADCGAAATTGEGDAGTGSGSGSAAMP